MFYFSRLFLLFLLLLHFAFAKGQEKIEEGVSAKRAAFRDISDTTSAICAIRIERDINRKKLKDYKRFRIDTVSNSFFDEDTEKKLVKALRNFSFSTDLLVQNAFRHEKAASGNVALNNFTLRGNLSINNFPLVWNYSHNHGRFNNSSSTFHLFQLNFNEKMFGISPRQRMDLFRRNRFNSLSQYTGGLVRKRIEADSEGIKAERNLLDYFRAPSNLKEIFTSNELDLKERILVLLNTGGTSADNSEIQASFNDPHKYRIADSIVATITSLKKRMRTSGLEINELLSLEGKYLRDEYFSESSESRVGSIRPKERLLSSVDEFKFGSFSQNLPGTSSEIFTQGMRLGLRASTNHLVVGYGGIRDLGLPKDAGFESNIYAPSKNVGYISIGTKYAPWANGKLSWISSSTRADNTVGDLSLAHNSIALSYSQSLDLKQLGKVSFDISKSANIYRNDYDFAVNKMVERKSFLGSYLLDDSFENMSFGFSHQGGIKRLNFSDNIYFNYSGFGYQNPGSGGFGAPRLKMGGQLKKLFFKNNLALNLRTDLRTTPVSVSSSEKWKNYQVQLDSRFAINRKFNLNFKYASNGMNKKSLGENVSVYSSERLQLGGNANYKIGKCFANSYFNIGFQSLENTFGSTGDSRFLSINFSQNAVVNKRVWTGHLFYNKEMTSTMLIGDMMNADLGSQYTLFKTVVSASSVTYLNNRMMNVRQVGIRQNLQVEVNKNFDFGAFFDLRKNLTVSASEDLFPSAQVDFNLKYYLKRGK